MKKVISISLIAVMLLSVFMTPVFATVSDSIDMTDETHLYQDAFVERYAKDGVYWWYDEVYYHYSYDETIDWCLINGEAGGIRAEMVCYLKFEDFIMSSGSRCYPFDMKYAVYDVEKMSLQIWLMITTS